MITNLDSCRWINPFILKLSNHRDLIISPRECELSAASQKILDSAAGYTQKTLELCAGSGTHLLTLAQNNPDRLIIGIELRFKRIVRTAEKAVNLGIKNVLLLQFNAELINELFPEEFFDDVYINFPDPWDSKKRWDDRFLLSAAYLSKISATLKKSGFFYFKTDHSRRFHQVKESIMHENISLSLLEHSQDLHSSDSKKQNIFTEFERLFSQQKKPVFYLMAQK